MKRILFNCTFLVILLSSISNAQAQSSGAAADTRPRTASIGGLVTVGGKPKGNVAVLIIETDRGTERVRKGSDGEIKPQLAFNTTTNADGRYRFSNLPAGTYRIRALSKELTMADAEATVAKFITIEEGEAEENINLSLIRGGVITGKVTNSEGKPLIAAQIIVRIMRISEGNRDSEERFENWSDQNSEMYQTDDRGIYRIYGLPKGRYIVGAGGQSTDGSSNPALNDISRIYYPSATDIKQAKRLEIDDSIEIADVDLKLGEAKKTYEVTGRVIDAETGAPVARAYVFCRPQDRIATVSTQPIFPTNAQGSFRLTGLTNGRYEIGQNAYEQGSQYYSDSMTIVIADGNLEGVELKAKRGMSISGTILFDGKPDQALWNKLKRGVLGVSVVHKSGDSGSTQSYHSPRIEDDGRFSVSGVPPGKVYFDSGESHIRPWHLLRIEHNGADAREGIEVVSGQSISGVRIIYTEGKGVIRGQVQIIGGALPENADVIIVAVPANEANNSESGPLTRFNRQRNSSALADNKGRFRIEELLPGEYELGLTISQRQTDGTRRDLYVSTNPEQRVTVANGAEASVTINFDPSKIKREK